MQENDNAVPGTSDLHITTEWQEGVRIVTAAGQVDLTNAHRLHAALSIALHPTRPLIADLSAVTFLDSWGQRTLLMMRRNADLQGARLLIVPSPEIAALINLAAADALTVRPSLATALLAAREHPTGTPDDASAPAAG